MDQVVIGQQILASYVGTYFATRSVDTTVKFINPAGFNSMLDLLLNALLTVHSSQALRFPGPTPLWAGKEW